MAAWWSVLDLSPLPLGDTNADNKKAAVQTASRLVVFSNRLPTGDTPSGGLVVALEKAVGVGDRDRPRSLWIGTAGDPALPAQSELRPLPGASFDRLALRLTPDEHRDYYLGYANSVLWPLCHGRPDLLDIRPEFRAAYSALNARLAEQSIPHLQPDDCVWVHDYHLIPLASELRKRGFKGPIGYFHHIPFPSAQNIRGISHAEQVSDWFVQYDLIGLQTQRDVSEALAVFRSIPGTELLLNGRIKRGRHTARIHSFPISIDVESFADLADKATSAKTRILPSDHKLIIGVDRLDYSKGLPQRLSGFRQFLRDRGAGENKVSLLQIAPPTREAVKAYSDIRTELERLSGEVNGEFAEIGYTPVQYLHRSVPRAEIAGYYRRANVGLVTSLADGMNLVAKEYVAGEDTQDPGVLVLSRFAGVHEQLGDFAVSVNPYDAVDVARGLSKAVAMPLPERRQRHSDAMRALRRQDVGWWSRTYLSALTAKSLGCEETAIGREYRAGAEAAFIGR